MALHDLTPQLRTRLSRMERAVGWFVILATALLLFGFGYYLYNTAQRKGWFKVRAPYYTFVDRATGLHVGDPVMLMGFEAGQITDVKPMPPEDFTYNVYVEFVVKEPNYGYLWTDGSRAKVVTADLLGKRLLEVTKGTGGYPTYSFHPFRELTLAEAKNLPELEKWKLAEDIYTEGTNGPVIEVHAMTPLTNLTLLASLGRKQVRVLDTREELKSMTAMWNDQEGHYQPFTKKTKYWLPSDESPAVSERLEKLVGQVEKALPNFLGLTNQIVGVLTNSFNLTSNLNLVAQSALPASSNLAYITAQLRGPGALGEWLLGSNAQHRTDAVLDNAASVLANTDTNLVALVDNLARSLDNLADITSNLNAQVQANPNMLGSISTTVTDTDDLVQGLKRHWLLRSAFKSKATNAPPTKPSSPKEPGRR